MHNDEDKGKDDMNKIHLIGIATMISIAMGSFVQASDSTTITDQEIRDYRFSKDNKDADKAFSRKVSEFRQQQRDAAAEEEEGGPDSGVGWMTEEETQQFYGEEATQAPGSTEPIDPGGVAQPTDDGEYVGG